MRLRMALFLLALGWICLLPASVFAQAPEPVYIVQAGDSLYAIAQRFGTTVEALVARNNIVDAALIIPGTELVIPGYEGVSGVLSYREISYGETLSTLSVRHAVSEEVLIKLNRVVHPNRLYVGQSIIYPQSESDGDLGVARHLLIMSDETQLEFAARHALNPWSVSGPAGTLERSWILPGESLLLPESQGGLYAFFEPLREVSITPSRATQGRTIVISVELDTLATLSGRLGDRELSFHALEENRFVALQGIHALATPGLYDLEIFLAEQVEGKEILSFSQPLRVVSGNYGFDPILRVPPETIDPEKMGTEDDLINSIISQVTHEKYWKGVFQFPSSYTEAFPSLFGSRRNYNEVGYLWYHTGLDFYGGVGTPILAPARGQVVFAGSLDVRGDVTFIDHGWGVFTGYLHQSEILVSPGDWVEAGQEIGRVGRTGRVTGPHLHWEIWVGSVPVDPIEWTSASFP